MIKTDTLKKNYEFKIVLTKGNYVSGRYVECFFLNNHLKEKNLIGIAISSKIAKAVTRNRIKRIIREAYKEIEEKIITGKSFVFLWKKNLDVSNATYINIKTDILNIMKEIGVFIDE